MERMDRPRISVIMPSYNVCSYIRACIESVLAQTLDDMEILMIDAGSEDGTLDILQAYANQDARIRLVCSDRKSYGYQVNMGIRMARGKYIGIVETDDFIERDMYRTLYECAVQNGVDYVRGRGSFYREIAGGMTLERPIRSPIADENLFGKVLDPREHPEFVYSDRFLWLGLYRSAFVKTLRLNETPGAAYQDIGFMLQVHSKAEKAVYLDQEIYHYRLDNTAASAYDERAFRFLAQEMLYKETFLKDLSGIWRKYSALELLDQTRTRFHKMALSGRYWEAAVGEIEQIRSYLEGLYQTGVIGIEDMGAGAWAALQLLLESPEALYAVCRFDNLAGTYDVRLLERKIADEEVVIFGAGWRGRYCHKLLTAQGIGRVRLYCDRDPDLQGTRQQGVMVRSLEEAYAAYPAAIYMVPGGGYADEMLQQLSASGIDAGRIVLYTGKYNEEGLL